MCLAKLSISLLTLRRGPGSHAAAFGLARCFCLCLVVCFSGIQASAQSPPRDDSHWVRPPGTVNIAGNRLPAAADIDASGRVVAAFNVVPNQASSAGYVVVARFDTTTAAWTTIGGVLRFQIVGARGVVAMPNGDIYVGGNFFDAINADGSSTSVTHVVQWDEAQQRWDNMGGGLDGPVEAVEPGIAGTDMCVVGSFQNGTNRSGQQALLRSIGCWTGSDWVPVGGGVSSTSYPVLTGLSVAANGDVLVAGQPFESYDSFAVPGAERNRIARWTGGAWQDLAGGLDTHPVSILVTAVGDVFASGFGLQGVNGGGNVTGNILRFDGSNWLDDTAGLAGTAGVTGLAHAAGGATYAHTSRDLYRKATAGTAWMRVGQAALPSPYYFTANAASRHTGDEFYVGGQFSGIDDMAGSTILSDNHARWDGSRWHSMTDSSTSPPDARVWSVAATGGSTYGALVGGAFQTVGPLPARKAALFDGHAWQSFGGGVTAPDSAIVYAITSSNAFPTMLGATFYVGGEFTEVGQPSGAPVAVSNIAGYHRQSSSWFSLGQGVDGPVHALAYYDGAALADEVLYVGGSFSTATNADGSTVAANGIARWIVAENRWEPLGKGASPNANGAAAEVLAIDVAKRLSFTPFGSEPHDHDVFVGGRFGAVRNQDGRDVAGSRNIAWFSAREGIWRATGRGADSTVRALQYIRHPIWPFDSAPHTFNKGVLYAGGDFRVVRQDDGAIVVADHIAKWRIDTNTWDLIGSGPLENGLDGPVHALEVHPTLTSARWLERVVLIVGGAFQTATGSDGVAKTLHNIALLDDGEPLANVPEGFFRERFLPFGSGTDDTVRTAVALICEETLGGESVYVGGDFSKAGGKPMPALAKWTYTPGQMGPRLAVVNASPSCQNCAASVTGPIASNTCGGNLAKAVGPDVELFSGLDFGESVAVAGEGLPVGAPLAIAVSSGGTLVASIDSFYVESRQQKMLVLAGVDTPGSYAANPDGKSTSLALHTALAPAIVGAGEAGSVGVQFFNASTDAPAVDVLIDGIVVSESIPYGQPALTPVVLTSGSHEISVRRSVDGTSLGTWTAEFGDQAATMVLRGFVDPASNQNGPGLVLDVIDVSGLLSVGVEERNVGGSAVGATVRLEPTYPNPFADVTNVRFELERPAMVRLSLYDVVGREVMVLVRGTVVGGVHDFRLKRGLLPSGVYFLRLESGKTVATRSVVVVGG